MADDKPAAAATVRLLRAEAAQAEEQQEEERSGIDPLSFFLLSSKPIGASTRFRFFSARSLSHQGARTRSLTEIRGKEPAWTLQARQLGERRRSLFDR